MFPQQVTTGPAPMEEVERTKVVMVHPQQRTGFAQRNPYAIDVDKERNCYSCGEFGHMEKYCRNRRTGNRIWEGRRLEYGENERQGRVEGGNGENLNGEQDLILLD